MQPAGEFLALLREATPASMERAARLLPVCAAGLDGRQRRQARRMIEHAAALYRHAMDAGGPGAGYGAHGESVAEAEPPRLALEG